jgi:glycine/D-amino acid oxidase-like deaminating enzyme
VVSAPVVFRVSGSGVPAQMRGRSRSASCSVLLGASTLWAAAWSSLPLLWAGGPWVIQLGRGVFHRGARCRGEASRHDRRSYWIASTDAPELSSLKGPIRSDVVVIGAGIVGLTAALLLCEADRKVVVLEADRVAGGVSGYTTAKLTVGHGLAYSRLEHAFGRDHARAYAESQTAALDFVRDLCGREEIECDLEERTNIVYSASSSDAVKVEEEAAAASRAGLSASLVQDPGLPFLGGAAAVRLTGQAQFHVRKYLLGLLSLVRDAGVHVFENSRVEEITGTKPYETHAAGGTVSAPVVVVATHYPIVGQGFFATRIHPRRSYVLAAPLTRDVDLDGMFITATPRRDRFGLLGSLEAGASSWSEARATP